MHIFLDSLKKYELFAEILAYKKTLQQVCLCSTKFCRTKTNLLQNYIDDSNSSQYNGKRKSLSIEIFLSQELIAQLNGSSC